jgi:hypothetical protein
MVDSVAAKEWRDIVNKC